MLPVISNRIFGLDVMRTSAILMVLSSHTVFLFREPNFEGLAYLHFFGFFGVEVFFVLSGFLIGNILYKAYVESEFSFSEVKKFWIRRWLRTLPNYYLVLIINILLAIFVWESTPERMWSYFVFLQNIQTQPSFFNESWSLTIEEYAYLLLPVFLFLFVRNSNRKRTFLRVTILLLLLFLAAKYYYHWNTTSNSLDYWNLNLKAVLVYRIDAIVYGVLGCWIINNYKDFIKKYQHLFLLSGFFVVGILLFGLHYFHLSIEKSILFRNVFYLPVVSIGVMLSLPFFYFYKTTNSIFEKPIVLISKISYSIYLFHYFILLYLFTHFFGPHVSSPFEKLMYVLAYLGTTFLFSYLIYNYFEKPILLWRNKKFS